MRSLLITLLFLLTGVTGVWGQVADGIYYIRNNATNQGYLWPSLTTNTTTGYRYLTTSLDTSAEAVTNNNGVSYPAHDKSYSHWVVKNVTGGYIQLINPRLNKYVVLRKFPKEDNTKPDTYGDRDVWLTDEPAAEDVEYSYFVLNNTNSPYKISPKPRLNGVNTTTGYSFNSAVGDDRVWLTWSGTGNSDKPQKGENRAGLIQLYSGGTPEWSFTSDLLDAPTISDVDVVTNTVTITDANGLAEGYQIRYTTDGSTIPTASTGTVYSGAIPITSPSFTIKAVVVRYGIVLTNVATETREPAPCATPIISYDYTSSEVSITCATANANINYTTDGGNPNTSSTLYNGAFPISAQTTIKAIATKQGWSPSGIAETTIYQVATPTIQNNGSNAISITSATEGATIYYTTDGSTPTTGSTPYTSPLTENVSNVTIKAIAVKENMITSAVGSGTVKLQCATPVITRNGMTFSISCSMPTDATFYYSLDGSTPATSYSGPVSFTSDQLPMTVKAVAKHSNYTDSETATFELLNGTGTPSDPYLIYGATDFTSFISDVNAGTTSSKCYKLCTDVSASGISAITTEFTGTFDGDFHTITSMNHALFNTVNGGTVKNVILDNVSITSGTNVGAICNEATGASRIYNCGVLATSSTVETDGDGYTKITSCSSTISGSGYVGGIVGLLDGSSRVINCFSYANITGGNVVGGIVGYNNYATTSSDMRTMVMNCMFYGDITGGSSKAPIYNGQIITNRSDGSGVSNFNYFWAGASYVQDQHIDVYHCALAAEPRYLQRFEFFRHLLNSNRELAAWWATGDRDNKDEIMKWVLEPSQIGTSTPYPILKAPYDSENHVIKYPSVVNIDAAHAEAFSGDPDEAKTQYNQGRKFDTTFTINIQDASSGAPTGASITTTSVTRNITDKDPKHFNFNYYKVQLPYYNDVGSKNYTGYKVVTGWKIVNIASGSHSFSTGSEASATVDTNGDITLTTPYNFADRKSTAKDLYSDTNKRVFSQGAYFDVPEGVTSITIEPYWGKCVYVSDEYADVVYNQTMTTPSNVTTVGGGKRYADNKITIDGSEQTVYTSMSAAVTGLNPSGTVYDNAIVLVGNVHSLDLSDKTDSKPYTIMSIDLDKDNEPDYSYILRFDGANGRLRVHPVRVDFLNVIGLGMAQKSTGGQGTYNFGIMQPLGWFEATNTALFRVTQFEYDRTPRSSGPMILHGGVIEQWVTVAETSNPPNPANAVTYYHVGSNVWFKEFHLGAHQDRQQVLTPHPPISVTGGDYDEFYLTGLYNTPNSNYDDNAECYINGGRFGKVAGTGMQGIGGFTMSGTTKTSYSNGNIIWQIDNADIDEFFAGGINAAHIAEGNITTVITNSRVDQFCGGPKFGDMNSDKKVVTNANNCTFRTFFGAGYGGNSYNREYPTNKYTDYNYGWNTWLAQVYKNEYKANFKGVSTRIDYQFIPKSDNTLNVARLFVDYVSFSLATTCDVTSKLTDCTITKDPLGRLKLTYGLGNFYGGGSLGKVNGPVKSTLTNCTVEGNVFGAGYSATLPTVDVMDNSFQREPYYDTSSGTYLEAILPAIVGSYTWQHANTVNNTDNAINIPNKILYTTADISKDNLGSVSGAVTLTITTDGGASVIGTTGDNTTGHVYGGGDESAVKNDTTPASASTTVNISGNTQVLGNVYGGGNHGLVSGSATVNIRATEPQPPVTP